MDARNLAAVESPSAIVVDENLDELEINATPRRREEPFDPGHAEQIARRQSVMESKISKIYVQFNEAGRQLPITEFAHKAANGRRPLVVATAIVPNANR